MFLEHVAVVILAANALTSLLVERVGFWPELCRDIPLSWFSESCVILAISVLKHRSIR